MKWLKTMKLLKTNEKRNEKKDEKEWKIMTKQEYRKDINAPAETVYKTMLGLDSIETYEKWSAEFNPTSTYKGKWQKGAKIYFLGTNENGTQGGMASEIVDLILFQFVSIRHYAVLDGEQEITKGEEVEKWAGGLENYSFSENDGVTTVTVETDVPVDYLDYFNESWPKALSKLKEIVEKQKTT